MKLPEKDHVALGTDNNAKVLSSPAVLDSLFYLAGLRGVRHGRQLHSQFHQDTGVDWRVHY